MTRRSEAGFTLMEMLVALSVFAIAALALMRLDAFAVSSAADLDDRFAARVTAQNEAALAATDTDALVRGGTRRQVDNLGRKFDVRRTVTPTDDSRFVRIDIDASEVSGRARSRLTIVRRVG